MTVVLLAGDSTVAACPAGAPLNVAKGGASTASHRAEGLWDALLAQANPGDFIIIQFGHNDQKRDDLPAHGAFRANLERFTAEARDAGTHPVLCTPVARRYFQGDRLHNTHGDYPDGVRVAAAATGAPLIDLTGWSTSIYERLGPVASKSLFTDRDDSHFCFTGAGMVAQHVGEQLMPMILDILRGTQ